MLKLFAVSMALILLAAACLTASKPVSDDMIYDQVRIRLSGDPVAKGGGFTVEVKQGVVTLTGTAETQPQKDRAGKLAKKVNGVKQVINNLTVAKSGQ
ncbi:MAG: BON domain-containing protein [Bryobacteraceae bacterium]|jgi:hyperosmotically inducible periplasmic protein